MLPYTIDEHNCVAPVQEKTNEWWDWVNANLTHRYSFNLNQIRRRTGESFGGVVCRVFDTLGNMTKQTDHKWSYMWDQQTQDVVIYFETKNDALLFKLKL